MSKPEFTVSAAVQPLADRTDPDQDRYAFAYTITIQNTGDVPAQLIARHWVITDARGHMEEVRGLAVVGHQPLLQPGEQFQYTSWAQITTPQGSMRGTFFCFTHDAHPFEVAVEEFGLTTSSSLH
jgi:ApaG protein